MAERGQTDILLPLEDGVWVGRRLLPEITSVEDSDCGVLPTGLQDSKVMPRRGGGGGLLAVPLLLGLEGR